MTLNILKQEINALKEIMDGGGVMVGGMENIFHQWKDKEYIEIKRVNKIMKNNFDINSNIVKFALIKEKKYDRYK